MRPLVKHSKTGAYKKEFQNSASLTTDKNLYFIRDYPYTETLRDATADGTRLTDFFLNDYSVLPKIEAKRFNDKNPGEISYIVDGSLGFTGDLGVKLLPVTASFTLHGRIQTVQKHTAAARNKYLRLLIPMNEVKELLKLQLDKTMYNTEPAVTGIPPLITNFQQLNDKLIKPVYKILKERYRDAKEELIMTNGLYCAYCENLLTDGIVMDIEHKLPKASFPDVMVDWDNLVVSCKACNQSNKGNNPKQVFGAQRIIYGNLLDPKNLDIRIETNLVPQENETLESFCDELKEISEDHVYDKVNKLLKLGEEITKDEKEEIEKLCKEYGETESGVIIEAGLDTQQEVGFYLLPANVRTILSDAGHHYDVKSKELTITVDLTRKDDSQLADLIALFDKKKAKKKGKDEDDKIADKLKALNDAYLKLASLSLQLKFENKKGEGDKEDKKDGKEKDKEKSETAYLNFPSLRLFRSNTPITVDYSTMKAAASAWNLWPDEDVYNPLQYLKYTYIDKGTETVLVPGNKSGKEHIDNQFVYKVQRGTSVVKFRVDVERIEPNTGDAIKFFGTKSIMDIVGINKAKDTLTDSRHGNRAKAWHMAWEQLELLKRVREDQEKKDKLYTYFKKPVNAPKAPEGAEESEWDTNWKQLLETFDTPGVVLPEMIWNNVLEIACATGFYSTWLTVFKTIGDMELARELAQRLAASADAWPNDPHKYHSTNKTFVNDFINAT
ncbi:HNH endonuclease [Chitinophaga sp. HK235]|uniref:HNH endonuclease n=1 Tax=Chitinophaga sp. HK235 TaxID=2952571 RepID=UPI001BAA0B95|nr:hypothetical protein [Chitinophaga sp. HK235]